MNRQHPHWTRIAVVAVVLALTAWLYARPETAICWPSSSGPVSEDPPMHGTESPSPWVCRWTPLIRPAGHVLDLACGGGRHMQWLALQGHRVLGVDRSPEALALAAAFGPTLQADI